MKTTESLLLGLALLCAHHAAVCALHSSFHSMYAFGDSLTDTGNAFINMRNSSQDGPLLHLPNGETFFHRPSGRASDGRILVDFLAKRVGAPTFLLPYLGLDKCRSNGTQQHFVNFAVVGAIAQSMDFLKATYNITRSNFFSTDLQLQWFSTLPISKSKVALSKALIYFGEIGVNDYNLAIWNKVSIDEIIIEVVPNVLKAIQNALEFLIQRGVRYLVIEGGYPVGCTPIYTQLFFPNATTDKYGCVKELHRLRIIHDKLLKELVQNLTVKYNHNVNIVFFEQSKAFIEILKHPHRYGFTNTTDPCFIVFPKTKLCPNPSKYVSWDGIHFTEATNNALLNLFYIKKFVTPYPNFLTLESSP